MITTGIVLLLALAILVTLLVKCVMAMIGKIPRKPSDRIYVKNSKYHIERSRAHTMRIMKPYRHQQNM